MVVESVGVCGCVEEAVCAASMELSRGREESNLHRSIQEEEERIIM